jgi:hypothetical protein
MTPFPCAKLIVLFPHSKFSYRPITKYTIGEFNLNIHSPTRDILSLTGITLREGGNQGQGGNEITEIMPFDTTKI